MRNQLRCIALIGMLLSLLGCSNAAPELPGDIEIVDIIDTEPNIIKIHTPTREMQKLFLYQRQFRNFTMIGAHAMTVSISKPARILP